MVERTEIARGERCRQLHRERFHIRLQWLEQGHERVHLTVDIAKATFMGDGLWQLEHEPERFIHLPGPALHGGRRRHGVERGVALHGIHQGAVGGQFTAGRGGRR